MFNQRTLTGGSTLKFSGRSSNKEANVLADLVKEKQPSTEPAKTIKSIVDTVFPLAKEMEAIPKGDNTKERLRALANGDKEKEKVYQSAAQQYIRYLGKQLPQNEITELGGMTTLMHRLEARVRILGTGEKISTRTNSDELTTRHPKVAPSKPIITNTRKKPEKPITRSTKTNPEKPVTRNTAANPEKPITKVSNPEEFIISEQASRQYEYSEPPHVPPGQRQALIDKWHRVTMNRLSPEQKETFYMGSIGEYAIPGQRKSYRVFHINAAMVEKWMRQDGLLK